MVTHYHTSLISVININLSKRRFVKNVKQDERLEGMIKGEEMDEREINVEITSNWKAGSA